MVYNVVLVPGVQQNESVQHIHISFNIYFYLLNFNGASKPSSNSENEILRKKILPALSKR